MLLAPRGFKGTLTAHQAAEAMAAGWRRQAPADELILLPLSDGGRDFLEAMRRAPENTRDDPWRLETTTVTGPDGSPRPVTLQQHQPSGWVYLSTEEILGGPPTDLARATSRGLGEALAAVLHLEPAGVVVGVGEVAVHDGGAGLLAALGAGPAGRLGAGPLPLAGLGGITGLREARARFAGLHLVAAVREQLPLLGLSGTSALTAVERGAGREQAQAFEAALSVFAHRCRQELGLLGRDLLPGGRALHQLPGSGAGGGLGFALAVLGFDLQPGPQWAVHTVGLPGTVARVDLVVTGEGCFDWSSLRQSVPVAVAEAGLATGVPVIVLAGQVEAGRREITSIGIESAYPVADTGPSLAAALADPAGSLAARAARVARTWSRPR